MPRRRRGRNKAEGGLPQPAKSEGRVKETDDNAERVASKVPPKAVLDALLLGGVSLTALASTSCGRGRRNAPAR